MIGWSVVKSESNSASDRPCGCSLLGLQAHEVDDVDDPHLQVGQALAEDRRRGERLERRDVAAAAEHDVGLARPSSVDAQSQMPSPRVQWTIASSIGR